MKISYNITYIIDKPSFWCRQVNTIHINYKIQYDTVLHKLKEFMALLLCPFDFGRLLTLMLAFLFSFVCLSSCLILPSK